MRVQAENVGKRKPWQFMSRFVIQTSQGGVYLDRLRIIDTPWFGIFLHKFLRPDSDPFVHDHPWTFFSIVLRGGYYEVVRDNMTRKLYTRHIGRFNLKRRDDAHYIIALDQVPTWTLVFHGKRRRTWGFNIPEGRREGWVEFEEWEKYKQDYGIGGPRPKMEVQK